MHIENSMAAAALVFAMGVSAHTAFARDLNPVLDTVTKALAELGLDAANTPTSIVPVYQGADDRFVPQGYQAWISLPDGHDLVINMDWNGREIDRYERALARDQSTPNSPVALGNPDLQVN